MRFALFEVDERTALGAVFDHSLVDLVAGAALILADSCPDPGRIARGHFPADMKAFLEGGDHAVRFAREVVEGIIEGEVSGADPAGPRGEKIIYPLGDVALKAPVSRDSKVIGIGGSFLSHLLNVWRGELDAGAPDLSLEDYARAIRAGEMVAAPANCNHFKPHPITGPDEVITIYPPFSRVNGGVELGVVIGKSGRNIPVEEAPQHIFGYTAHNDVTMRDPECAFPHDKLYEGFGPTGPWIVTRDEIPDCHDVHVRLLAGGRVLQDGSTRELEEYRDILCCSIPEQVSLVSSLLTLEVGDVIATGSPGSLRAVMDGPNGDLFLDGQSIEAHVEGVGVLRNTIRILR